MKQTRIHNFHVKIGLNILILILLFFVLDFILRNLLDDMNIISLQNKSENDLTALQNKIDTQKQTLKSLTSENENLSLRNIPTLQDIKSISNNYALNISNIQKNKNVESSISQYAISIQGSIYNLLRFLNTFESVFILDVESVYLTPIDQDGNKLKLELLISIQS